MPRTDIKFVGNRVKFPSDKMSLLPLAYFFRYFFGFLPRLYILQIKLSETLQLFPKFLNPWGFLYGSFIIRKYSIWVRNSEKIFIKFDYRTNICQNFPYYRLLKECGFSPAITCINIAFAVKQPNETLSRHSAVTFESV